jgi:hypothetical protein
MAKLVVFIGTYLEEENKIQPKVDEFMKAVMKEWPKTVSIRRQLFCDLAFY